MIDMAKEFGGDFRYYAASSRRLLRLLLLSVVVAVTACSPRTSGPLFNVSAVPKRDFGSRPGVLIIKLDLAQESVRSSARLRANRIDSYTLKNIRTGYSQRVTPAALHGSVLELPPGRYCIDSIFLHDDKFLHCSPPFFDIEEDAVEVGGLVSFALASGNSVVIRDIKKSTNLPDYQLTGGDAELLSGSFKGEEIAQKGVWYLDNVMGKRSLLFLKEDGLAELKEYSATWPSYSRGQWRQVENQTIVSFYGGQRIYKMKSNSDISHGLIVSRYKTDNPWATVNEEWLFWASRKPFFDVMPYDFSRDYYLVVAPGIAYPEDAYKKRMTGAIDLEFNLIHDDEVISESLFKPENIRVVSSTIEFASFSQVISDFSKYRYLSNRREDGLKLKCTERLHFGYKDGALAVSTSEDPGMLYRRK